jgi:hypothetical protein
MAQDFALRDHVEWINYLQPEGLVVSARALVDAQVVLDNATLRDTQERLRAVVVDATDPEEPRLRLDLPAILRDFLRWPLEQLDGWDGAPLPPELVYENADLGVRLAPTYALRTVAPKDGEPSRLMLVQALAPGEELDTETEVDRSSWKTTPSRRFERLLRETKVPIGLIADATSLRLVYAPPQENTGTLTFPLAAMTEIAGRKILGGFHALLSRERLFTGPREARLPALLEKSRKAQAAVSTALAAQVLESLYELVRGLQSADARMHGELLREVLARQPDHVYQGLLNVLLRLITLLYAEDRGLLPQSDLFVRNYSLRGLYERLRADHERYADTMDGRFGAWHQLLVLFRLVNRGCEHPAMRMPARRGGLFDPERFGFLEGRTLESPQIPLVPDGTIYRVLDKLLIVDGERLSYRTLDVEHIGSVYETMMGFRMERASGPSVALKPAKSGGAPTTIDLEKLLAEPSAKRAAWIKANADQKVDGKAGEALRNADSLEALRAALDRRIAHTATPDIVAPGSMVLQPSDERRKSGSHYTPRSLTEPIVRKTFEPIFARLGADATAEQILDLRVCDPAMGSGAFLVEACRQLAQRLKLAWERHRVTPTLPPDEDLDLFAMRLVAQRCLYGVDKNPVAADLAKLSLWLATLARDHAFTFLDHALKCGDSLVGLDREQLASFHWKAQKQLAFVSQAIGKRVDDALALRDKVRSAPDGTDELELRRLNSDAEASTEEVRRIGDLVIAAFFSADSDKKREAARKELEEAARSWLEAGVGAATVKARVDQLCAVGVAPFHWWLEFPEVFLRANAGFDAFCGNPPFVGGRNLTASAGDQYQSILLALIAESSAAADLVARFFRRAFDLLRTDGCFGLIATKTIRQGDARSTGLRWICTHGGTIYSARTRLKWSGSAAVVVSVVHVARGTLTAPYDLDGRQIDRITAFLFHAGGHEDPKRLLANAGKSFQGSIVLGMGFTFDDTDRKGVASPLADMHRLIAKDPRNAERIFPYIGGEEVNDSPTHAHHRYVINFGEMTEQEARQWPDLMQVVESRVRPARVASAASSSFMLKTKETWWLHAHRGGELYRSVAPLARVLAITCSATPHVAFTFLGSRVVYANSLAVISSDVLESFCTLSSRIHESWARFFGSSMKDDLRYTPSDCFETFPFPPNFESNPALEAAGKDYYEFRAELMVRDNEGLTKTYNRFHDPAETSADIARLRELHAAIDRAVLDAYGWSDIPTACQFIPDYFEEDDDGNETPKSLRYRWPDEVRDEVLARLLALNQQRYDEEVRLGLHSKPKSKGSRKPKPSAGDLFGAD